MEARPLDLARKLLSADLAERQRALKHAVKVILAEQAAKGSVRSGNTLIQLGRRSEAEIRERASLTIEVGRRVLADEKLDTVDDLARQFKELAETTILSAYKDAWTAITEPAPIQELQRTNTRAVQQIQWQVSEVRNEQIERSWVEIDLFVRSLRGRQSSRSSRKRWLAAIVALDVVGYSARMEENEANAIDEVVALRTFVQTIAKAHAGRTFNTAGDGFMLEFESCADALGAAEELVNRCEPKVRVGVHVGDVTGGEAGDVLGHVVNIAARLEKQSRPGVVFLSGDVRRMIRGSVAARLKACGQIQLEKMSEVIDVFELLHGDSELRSEQSAGGNAS